MKDSMDKLYEELDESFEGEFRHRALNTLIRSYIVGKKILDLGCGSGVLLKFLLENGYDAVGFDSSKAQCKLAQNRLRKSNLNPKAVRNIPLEKTNKWEDYFDSVICIDVLEHMKNDSKSAKDLIKMIKPGGRLIAVVPALPRLWSKRDEKYGHYRRYTKEILKSLFLGSPVKILVLKHWNFIGAIIAWVIFKLHLDLKADRYAASQKFPMSAINHLLELWIRYLENNISAPFGLSLVMVAKREK